MKLGPWNDQGYRLYGHASRTSKVHRGRQVGALPGRAAGVVRQRGQGGGQRQGGGLRRLAAVAGERDRPGAAGANEVEVIVIGTLRNTAGAEPPSRHGLHRAGSWDSDPAQGPPAGRSYTSVGYGLFEPFVLDQVTSAK